MEKFEKLKKMLWKVLSAIPVVAVLGVGLIALGFLAAFVWELTLAAMRGGVTAANLLSGSASITSILGSGLGFILEFVLLVACYVALFVMATILFENIWCLFDKKTNRLPWRQRCTGTLENLRTNNNRRWEYLFLMTIITSLIALDHPGPSLIVNLPATIFGTSTMSTVSHEWNFFWYADSLPAVTPVSLQPTTTWFWWWAATALWAITIVYFFFAFSDEVVKAFKDAYTKWEKHQAAHQQRMAQFAAQQAAAPKVVVGPPPKGFQPPPTPVAVPVTRSRSDIPRLLGTEIVAEIAGTFLVSLWRHYMNGRKGGFETV